jgi:hypothetical protein
MSIENSALDWCPTVKPNLVKGAPFVIFRHSPTDPMYLRKTVTGVMELVADEFERLCQQEPQMSGKYCNSALLFWHYSRWPSLEFLKPSIVQACRQMHLDLKAFWFACDAYASLEITFKRLLFRAANRVLGNHGQLAQDGYPIDLSKWVPEYSAEGSEPIELYERMMFDETCAAAGYYGRGLRLLHCELPKLALVDLEKASRLGVSRIKSASTYCLAITKWKLSDRSGAEKEAARCYEVSSLGVDRFLAQRLMEEMLSGRFDGDFSKICYGSIREFHATGA